MNIGNRVFYDQDGEIICQSGEMQGDVLPRKEITELNYIDLDYGAVDLSTQRIVSVDPITRQPVIEAIEATLTPEQQRIKELEDALLLAMDNEIGGIL